MMLAALQSITLRLTGFTPRVTDHQIMSSSLGASRGMLRSMISTVIFSISSGLIEIGMRV